MANNTTGPIETPLMQLMAADPEKVAHNIALVMEASAKAAAAYVEPRETGARRDTGSADQLTDVVRTLAHVGDYWLRDPGRAVEAQTKIVTGMMDLWSSTLRRMNGEDVKPVAEPAPGDKRFADTEWKSNIFFDTVKQAYLLSSRWAEDLVAKAEDIDTHTRHKADFYVKQISAAMSPSNFVVTNRSCCAKHLQATAKTLYAAST